MIAVAPLLMAREVEPGAADWIMELVMESVASDPTPDEVAISAKEGAMIVEAAISKFWMGESVDRTKDSSAKMMLFSIFNRLMEASVLIEIGSTPAHVALIEEKVSVEELSVSSTLKIEPETAKFDIVRLLR